MSEIILCNQSQRTGSIAEACGINPGQITSAGGSSPSILNPYTPYLVEETPGYVDTGVLCKLAPMPVSREITNMALSFGADNTVAIADIMARLKDYSVETAGASLGLASHRMQRFAGAVGEYQDALMVYRDAARSKSVHATAAKQKARAAFNRMQRWFHAELSAVTRKSRQYSRKGTPLTNPERALDIARSSRRATKLNVNGTVQASQLAMLAKNGKYLGNGLVVIDFSTRVGNIHTSYLAGEKWERELFIESSSFVAGATAGVVAAGVGSSAMTSLGLMVAATPVGWVFLIVGGIAVVGAAAGSSMWASSVVKDNSGSWYDDIMRWLGNQ